mgnify:CR=1 FL=1
MLARYLYLSIITLFIGLTLSCNKKPQAGPGGNASLKVRAKHHGTLIDSAKIHIKYNSMEAVSLSEYDAVQAITNFDTGDSYTIFSGLKKGEYYLYGEGWDPSIFSNVKGGLPFKIDEEKEYEIIVAVTEQH